MPIGPEGGVEHRERVARREPVGLERNPEVELPVGSDQPIGRDEVRGVEDRGRAGVVRLLEPVDHVETVRRGHVDHDAACRSVGRLGLLAVPLAGLVGGGTLRALAPGVESKLREDHQVATKRRGLGDDACHLLERGRLVTRHGLEVHTGDGDLCRTESRVVRAHGRDARILGQRSSELPERRGCCRRRFQRVWVRASASSCQFHHW